MSTTQTTIETRQVGPFELRVWSEGTGDPPLLFLHGYERHPGGASFLRRLAEARRVLAPEQPGYGKSTGLEHIHEVVDLALLYRELVESLGVDQVDLIGHSWGGMVAGELAALSPHFVRKLVLVDAFGLWLDDQPSLDPWGPPEQVAAAKWHDPEAIPEEPTIFEPDPDDPHALKFFTVGNLATAAKFLWPIPDRGLRRRLPYVKAPTLVVQGASDGLVPIAYGEELARLIPGAELVTIAEAGHYPMIEREDAFIEAVEGFLQA
jgi:pimeloyl-ACP methyl ester carboxylesterase